MGSRPATSWTGEEVLTRAVLFERAKGASWKAIAEQVDMKRQSTHERYRWAEQG